jgi:hypothetical protein
MLLKNIKPYTKFKLFTPTECKDIVKFVKNNEDKIELWKFVDLGAIQIDGYRLDEEDFSDEIKDLIIGRVSKLSKIDVEQAFILEYTKDKLPHMKPHYDICTHTLIINLTNDFEGGETYFPVTKYKLEPKNNEIGTALYFKGDTLKSWHMSLPVTSGVKYSLNIKFQKKKSMLFFIFSALKLYFVHKILTKYYKL